MTKVVVLDAGHGGKDPGASAYGLKEKDWALDMVKRVGNALNQYEGVSVLYTRTSDVYVSINQRWQYANNKNAHYFFSFHINAGGGRGFESYIDNNASAETRRIQPIITNDVLAFLKSYGIGAHGNANKVDNQSARGNIGVLSYTRMPAVLFENLFIDNQTENNLLKSSDFKAKLANVYARSIAKCLGLKEKSSSQKTSTGEELSEPAENMHDLFYLKDNELVDVISSKHPERILPKVEWLMRARADCVLMLKRGWDIQKLKEMLNKKYPDTKE